jgi:hypothetical protein
MVGAKQLVTATNDAINTLGSSCISKQQVPPGGANLLLEAAETSANSKGGSPKEATKCKQRVRRKRLGRC